MDNNYFCAVELEDAEGFGVQGTGVMEDYCLYIGVDAKSRECGRVDAGSNWG